MPDSDAEWVRINGNLYRVIEWDLSDSNDGEYVWTLYAQKVEE